MRYRILVFFFTSFVNAWSITYEVTFSGDSGPGSFRQAILDLNANSNGANIDTIQFDQLLLLPIILSSDLPIINRPVVIYGENTTVDGNGQYKFPTIYFYAEIYALNFQNGNSDNSVLIAAANSCLISRCQFKNNTGKISVLSHALGELILDECTFINNDIVGTYFPGAIFLSSNSSSTHVINCQFYNNTSTLNYAIVNFGGHLTLMGELDFGINEAIRITGNDYDPTVEILDGEVKSDKELVIIH